MYVEGQRISVMSSEDMCKCLHSYERVDILGDSHLEHFSLTLRNVTCMKQTMVVFHRVKHSTDLSEVINRYMDTLPRSAGQYKKGIAIWLQSGSWDLKWRTTQSIFSDAVPRYFNTLTRLNKLVKTLPNVKFYLLTPPPNPFALHVNNYDTASYSYLVERHAKKEGIPLFDMFSAIHPCVNDNVNRNHYWEFGQGEIGRVYWFGYFMSTFCSNAALK